MTAEVRGHDDDSVAEVDGTALRVGQTPIIKHLEQDVEHIRVSLLNLIEQDYRVRLTANSLSKLTTLIVAHISWRRTYQSCHAELLLILTHVNTSHHGLIIEKIVGKSFCKLSLTHTRSAEEDEAGYWSLRVLKSCTRTANSITDGCYCLVLTDNTVVQFLFKMQKFLTFALEHTRDRNTRPTAYNLCYVILSNLLLNHSLSTLS